MILLIDNYDSFTFNLVQRLGEIDPTLDMKVVRNDQITVDEIESMKPDRIIVSPGPCTPAEAESRRTDSPICGTDADSCVCPGHQCMAKCSTDWCTIHHTETS